MFSVVIPLFQKRAYIRRTLDSVLAQTIGREAVPEIIVVNDGSTDGGDAVARERADPRIRVIDQPNRGVSAARNAGIAAAGQPYVAFLDADDRWRPPFLERMRDLVARYPGAVLYGSGFTTVRGDVPEGDHGVRPAELLGGGVASRGTVAGPVDFFRAWRRDHVVHPSGMIVPREAALAIGGFRDGLAHCEDHLFLAMLGLAGAVVLTAEPLVDYDVAVPGQFIDYWRGPYRERFDVLEYHRFLAAELRRRAGSAADRSFVAYARGQLRTAVMQRLYWGNFAAVDRLWRELDLAQMGLGGAATVAAWLARRRGVQPLAALGLRAVRGLRAAARTETRAA